MIISYIRIRNQHEFLKAQLALRPHFDWSQKNWNDNRIVQWTPKIKHLCLTSDGFLIITNKPFPYEIRSESADEMIAKYVEWKLSK